MPFNILDYLRRRKNRLLLSVRSGIKPGDYTHPDLDFSVAVCKCWEKTFFEQKTPGTRKIALRTAITLGHGGAIIPYLNLCKFGLGGRHGNGRQMFSWVHEQDLAGMIEWIFENKHAEGIYNCAAPGAVTNKEFMQTLRRNTHHVFGILSPAIILELGAFIIRSETELMMKSRWVYPARALKEGFQFKYNTLEEALRNIIGGMKRKQYHLF